MPRIVLNLVALTALSCIIFFLPPQKAICQISISMGTDFLGTSRQAGSVPRLLRTAFDRKSSLENAFTVQIESALNGDGKAKPWVGIEYITSQTANNQPDNVSFLSFASGLRVNFIDVSSGPYIIASAGFATIVNKKDFTDVDSFIELHNETYSDAPPPIPYPPGEVDLLKAKISWGIDLGYARGPFFAALTYRHYRARRIIRTFKEDNEVAAESNTIFHLIKSGLKVGYTF